MYLFYSYDTKTYIDHQTVVPSVWFRWWRPGFLIAGILYNVGMLGYSIYTADIFAVLLAVRITIGLYQLGDQLWLVKHWVPFFVLKEKRSFLFFRLYLVVSVFFLVVGSTLWTGSWLGRSDILANVYYISVFVLCFGCGMWYLVQGGIDRLVKYRLHWNRNLFFLCAVSGMILGIVGLILGDGGGNNLVETLKYHSAFVMVYFGLQCAIVVIIHRYMVVFEELSWKYPNPISSPSTLSGKEATTLEATNGIVSASNKVACDVDVPSSSIEIVPPGNCAQSASGDMKPSNNAGRFVEEDGKEEKDMEAAHGFVSQSAAVSVGDAPPSAISPSVTAPLTQAGSIVVLYQARRRFARAFDGITRRSSILRNNILTHHIMMAKLKRHEFVCREFDKLYCVLYQLLIWELVIWLAQIFLGLYLQSVNTPTPPGHDGYYCQTPIENTINSAQFINDFVFARR